MKIGVIGTEKWSCQVLVETVRELTGSGELIDIGSVAVDMGSKKVSWKGNDLADYDAIIIKKISDDYDPYNIDQLELMRYLEGQGVRIFSKPSSIISLLDRLSCTVTLQLGGIPMPPTTITESVDEAIAAVEKYGRAIVKPLWTSKARGMMVLDSSAASLRDELIRYREEVSLVFYLQKMLNIPDRDYGVVFLGGEYIGTYARVKQEGSSWNTTINSGGRYQPHYPSQEIIDMARRAQSLFDLDFTCVDVVEADGEALVFEVSAFGGFKGLKEALDIDAARLYTEYVIRKISNE